MNEPTRAFDNTQQIYPDDPVSVFLGTGLESVIDMASFGLLQPDIVPDYVERQHQIASTVGHVAGSVAGMLPSFGAAKAVVSSAFKVTRFGTRIVQAAEAGGVLGKAASVASRPFISGMGKTASAMMLHDVTREFIRQTREADPDLGRIGEVAVDAAISGGTLGYFGSLTGNMHPLVQANIMGAGFSVAEAINGAADGEDVFGQDFLLKELPKAYLQGFGLTLLFNAPGWKARRGAGEQAAIDAYFKRFSELEDKVVNGKMTYKTFVNEIEKYTGHKVTTKVEDIPVNVSKAIEQMKKYRGIEAPTARQAQNKIHQLKQTLNLSDESYRTIMRDAAGIESTSKQPVEKLNKVIDALEVEIGKAPELSGYPQFRRPGWIQSHLSPADELIAATNMKDFVGDALTAKQLTLVEQELAQNAIGALRNRWDRGYTEWKKTTTPFGRRVTEALAGRTPESAKALTAYNTGKADIKELPPELGEVVRQYRKIADVYHARTNQVRQMFGLGELNYVEWYQRQAIDVPAMIRAGRGSELDFLAFPRVSKTGGKFGELLVSTEKQRAKDLKNPPIYVDDPWAALQNMVHFDLKAIYLREPIKIAEANMRNLNSQGLLSDEGLVEGMRFLKHVVWGMPTEATQRANMRLRKLIESKPGQAIEQMLSQMNVDFAGNPAKSLNRLWGSLVSRAYMGLRPRQAFRNSLQVLYTHGFVDTKNLVKGMRDVNDAEFKKILDESLEYKMGVGQSGEHIGVGSAVDRIAFTMFQQSHVMNLERTMRATYYQVMDYITLPKYDKLGWADADGIEKRKTNPKYLSERERSFLKKEVDFIANHTQFLYNATGLPMVTRSDVAAPFFKLMSFPMNYRYKYIQELYTRATTGKPGWAKGMKDAPKLPWNNQYGFLKHFVLLGAVVAGAEQAGLDYSSMLGLYATGDENRRSTVPIPFTDVRVGSGVFSMRPSPGMSVLLNIKDALSDDPYISKMGMRNLRKSVPIPGSGAYQDIKKALTEGERDNLFTYKVYEKPAKSGAFEGFGGFGGFKAFKSF